MANRQNLIEADQDILLVDQFKRGDESAFDSLFYRYKDGIYSLVLRTVGLAEVDDAVQDAFIAIYKSISRFRGDSTFRTWAYRIALNVCQERLRRRYTQPQISDEDMESALDPCDLEAEVMGRMTGQTVTQAIEDLPQIERSAIEMHYAQDMSYTEIALVLKCPEGTIKARVHRAIAKLRRRLLPVIEEAAKR